MLKSLLEARAEVEALRRSQAVIEFSLDGTILTANENFCNFTGYKLSEIKGKHHRIFVDSEYAESAEYRLFWDNLRAGKFDRGQYRRFGKNGSEVWIEASYNPVLKGDKPYKIVKYAADITESKRLALEGEAKLRAVSSSQAVIEFTPDGTILTANENFCQALGYRLEEIVGRHHRIFCDPAYSASPEYSDFWRALAQGKFMADEFCRIAKNGSDVWIQASYNPVFNSKGEVYKVVKFATDVSRRMDAISQIGQSVAALENGDLTQTLDRPFVPTMENLRRDYNKALSNLRQTLFAVSESSRSIAASTGEIAGATGDLARRTERQAASVEEAAAALEEITRTVGEAANRTENMGKLVEESRQHAENSGQIVGNAVAAMGEIEQSSRQISTILSVIDEIAFQTNLLALNAGVEAARAGEAGKGFAVVAQEVRELAQRSASAAKDIRSLIVTSTAQVEKGVGLVAATGKALDRILNEVNELNSHVSALVKAAREQSGALNEINTSINVVDQSTQQNAAMVEETTAATHSLSREAESLFDLVKVFKLTSDGRGLQHAA
ncbi:methyl-accepting chemotaxis protein [Rhizobium paknamense]|uniref:Methyl-accepting chemotaxis protein n=1 Tax=Rhizobium paknamense TaxID=1206817 RepID=A0ABU0IJL0_9HYPH|nr:PAS domain-containing methyl-accepting chemotaxis protein [Rhizobium paknamense]MDQ0458449.1 methyl-accepting chemotaxis protein [Rhizobium paknamense]